VRAIRGWLYDHPEVRTVGLISVGLAIWILLATIGVHLIWSGR
jgi:hypothetical protein